MQKFGHLFGGYFEVPPLAEKKELANISDNDLRKPLGTFPWRVFLNHKYFSSPCMNYTFEFSL